MCAKAAAGKPAKKKSATKRKATRAAKASKSAKKAKSGAKAAKRPAKKTTKKLAEKAPRKPAKKATRKSKKKVAKKSPKKSVKKPAERTTKVSRKASASKAAKKKTKAKATRKKSTRKRRRASYLTPSVRNRLKQKLLEKRMELIGSVTSSAGDRREQKLDGTEDYIDYAVNSYDREFLLSLTELEQKELMLVEEALQRMERGDYGFCLASGEEIPLKRLEVQPWARYSVRNQELVDQGMLIQDPLRFDPDAVSDPLEEELEDEEIDEVDDEPLDDDDEDDREPEDEKHVV